MVVPQQFGTLPVLLVAVAVAPTTIVRNRSHLSRCCRPACRSSTCTRIALRFVAIAIQHHNDTNIPASIQQFVVRKWSLRFAFQYRTKHRPQSIASKWNVASIALFSFAGSATAIPKGVWEQSIRRCRQNCALPTDDQLSNPSMPPSKLDIDLSCTAGEATHVRLHRANQVRIASLTWLGLPVAQILLRETTRAGCRTFTAVREATLKTSPGRILQKRPLVLLPILEFRQERIAPTIKPVRMEVSWPVPPRLFYLSGKLDDSFSSLRITVIW